MKKTLKALVLALVIGLVVISLTGCGGNKLVATKTVEDEMQGNYKERVEITFKKDYTYYSDYACSNYCNLYNYDHSY